MVNNGKDKTVIRISSESMGHGDKELGKKLTGSFLDVLSQSDHNLKSIIFYNSGVFLACEDSMVLETLKDLEEKGITILSCGTCLNHFNLSQKLAAGKESNMVEITNTLFEADKVISL